ncbi:hypothetical protein [Cumulibacter soli]|uniref:hypothetical protein n=1 Tax=Cumulibacter soli TaxID=2546344 RepID=UPI001ABAD43D|nr:hypothetical protein [Cumulibacter soli]
MDINVAEMGMSALRVLGIGLIFGAGLPMLFALGMRMHAIGRGDTQTDDGAPATPRPNPTATAVAYLLYVLVVAAVVVGVLFVTRHTLGHYFGISLFGG